MVGELAELRAVLKEEQLLGCCVSGSLLLQAWLQVQHGLCRPQGGNVPPLLADTAQGQGMGDISEVLADLLGIDGGTSSSSAMRGAR